MVFQSRFTKTDFKQKQTYDPVTATQLFSYVFVLLHEKKTSTTRNFKVKTLLLKSIFLLTLSEVLTGTALVPNHQGWETYFYTHNIMAKFFQTNSNLGQN